MAYHLISIGITQYSNPANNLSYPDQDAGEISAILRHSLGDELTHDVLLRDSEATQIGIRTALDSAELKSASNTDTLIVFYSGHGAAAQNSVGENEAYLAPYDANGDIAISGISTTELKNILDNFHHGQKIIFLDCCYSGGANAKSITNITHKAMDEIKAFQNQSYAEGTFVFTACKADEKAIETHDLKHGLFTYHLIEELVRKRTNDNIPLSSIHDPVNNAVEKAAKTYNHTQTPTIQISSKGSMAIPKLSLPPALKPELIKVPTVQDERPPLVSAPRIDISDKKTQEILQSSITLVEAATRSKLDQVSFRSTLGKVLATVKEAHATQNNHIRTNEELSELLKKLEAKSYQLMLTSAAVAVAGDEPTLRIFSDEIAQILLWKRGNNGSVAAIETSDVIFLSILYIMFVCSIYTDDYMPVEKLLNAQFTDVYRGKYVKVVDQHYLHYASALGGNAKTVIEHMVELLCAQKWLLELLGIDVAKMKSLVAQSNLCLSVAIARTGERVYPGYNDFDLSEVAPLVNKIRSDPVTQVSMSKLFNVDSSDLPKIFSEEVAKLNQASGGHWWSYLKPEAFTTESGLVGDY